MVSGFLKNSRSANFPQRVFIYISWYRPFSCRNLQQHSKESKILIQEIRHIWKYFSKKKTQAYGLYGYWYIFERTYMILVYDKEKQKPAMEENFL